MKRTDLDGFGESAAERLRNEDEEGTRGRESLAWAKSADKARVLGCNLDGEEDLVEKPRNWDVRSSYWLLRRAAWSWILLALSLQ